MACHDRNKVIALASCVSHRKTICKSLKNNTMTGYEVLDIECSEIDQKNDMALLQIEEIFDRKPIKISQDLYSENEMRKSLLIHEEIIYTGYPQGMGPFTFNGTIVSHPNKIGYVFAHSYAWAGSSGSGVFDASGNLVGIITAVSVANSEYGVDVMEDLVIITPLSLSDLHVIF